MTEAKMSQHDVQTHVAAVASALSEHLEHITVDMRDLLSSRIEELDADKQLVDLLGTSIEGNVDRILTILQRDTNVQSLDPPHAAFEYARRLAQRGVPVNALVRAYRLGQQNLLQAAFQVSLASDVDPEIRAAGYERIVMVTFDYIDWISQRVVTVYESERERWLADRNAVRTARVEAILDGSTHDVDSAEAAIGYRLRRWNLGAVLWVDESGSREDQLRRFTAVVSAVAKSSRSGGAPLMIPRDRASVWAWIPVEEGFTLDTDAVEKGLAALDDEPPRPVIAFGRPGFGLDGFRRTHVEALQAQRVALFRGAMASATIDFASPGLGVTALLAADVDDARAWVISTLGDLAKDDEQHERLRATLRTFLLHDGSYTATAEAMLMHKNSVKYRVTSAEKALGRRVSSDRQSIELALTVCHWLGPVVLSPT